MNLLLLSMPDSFEHMPEVAIRMPNGALASLAGNIDPHHRVAIADLVLVQSSVHATVARLMHDLQPDVVGLSIMTFQRRTAFSIARQIRALRPSARVVAGGYDPSLAPEAYEECADIDFVVRGEGEHTFSDLLRALECGARADAIPGLSYRTAAGLTHNPLRPVIPLASKPLRLPDRGARILDNYTLLGRKVDVVETSRGCTYDCSFCSIIEMRGRNFHPYAIERVMADIADARKHGAEAIFLVDDNITLDVRRFESLCHAIIESGFHDIEYFVQAMTAPLAQHGATLAPLMKRAGFRYVFLGIENVIDGDLDFLKARSKNAHREHGRTVGNATVEAIEQLHRHGLFVVGGLIVGNPDDTRESIQTNLEFAKRYVDWPYIQHPTPYPRTPMTQTFRDRGLIVDDDVAHYDGTTAVVRSEHVPADEIEFLRWRAERWMKVRHLPAVFAHSPLFVLRHGLAMLAHTFTGTTMRSLVGLEGQKRVFERFRTARRKQREYVADSRAGRALSRVACALALLAVGFALPVRAANPRTFAVDVERSYALIDVGKAGAFSFMAGHVHEVRAPIKSGVVQFDADDPARSDVRLEFDAAAMRVTGKGEPPDDVPKVQAVMLGEQVLDVRRYPRMVFESTAVTSKSRGPAAELSVAGRFTLREVTKPLTAPVTIRVAGTTLTADGKLSIKQTDYGIKPISVAGVVKVRDALDIAITIVAQEK